jgi:hypothetical protein
MEWVSLTGYDLNININDKPRLLTPDEITYIVSHLPYAPSADSTAADINRTEIIKWMTQKLKTIQLCPSAIPDYINKIINQHKNSLVVPGTPVGTIAAEAIGAPATQMTLNTFHKSGSSKSASMGIESMRDLIFARKNPKNESCTIYFTNKSLSYEEVLDTRRYIVGSMVLDFVKDYTIDNPVNLQSYWWHENSSLVFPDKPIPRSSLVLRLYLNLIEMYKHKISITDIANVLEREAPPSVIALYGPMSDGIIDIYPKQDIISETVKIKYRSVVPVNLLELTFLKTIVYPELKQIRVKGISGIKQLYPVVSPVWRVVFEEQKITPKDLTTDELVTIIGPHINDAWYLFLNPDIMKATGIGLENVAALCHFAGITLLRQFPDSNVLAISMPNDRFKIAGRNAMLIDNKYYVELIKETPANKDSTESTEPVKEAINIIEGLTYKLIPTKSIQTIGDLLLEEIDTNTYFILNQNMVRNIEGTTYKQINPNTLLTLNDKQYEEILVKIPDVRIPVGDTLKTPHRLFKRLITEGDVNNINALYITRTNEQGKSKTELYEIINTNLGEVCVIINEDDIEKFNNKLYRLLDPKTISNNYELRTITVNKVTQLKPSEYINSKVSDDKRQIKERIKERTKELMESTKDLPDDQKKAARRKQIVEPSTNLIKANEFVIAETDGANLKEILALPGIDKNRTTCNNMFTIASTLGIEATRSFLIKALTNTIENADSYVHPSNITFIAEFITSRGEPYGATYTGISRQPGGHLSLATLERAGKVFTGHALFKRKEDIRNVSAAIAAGARISIGSGSFNICQEITVNGTTFLYVNEDLFTAMQKDDDAVKLTEEIKLRIDIPTNTTGDNYDKYLSDLKNLNDGNDTFDYMKDEGEASLLGMQFNNEMEKVVASRREQTAPITVVRRVNPVIDQNLPIGKFVNPLPQPPSELVNMTNFIKEGLPTSDVVIKPVQQTLSTYVPQPVVTTGLVSESFSVFPTFGVPQSLLDLFNKYDEEEVNYPEGITKIVDLPSVNVEAFTDNRGAPSVETAYQEMKADLGSGKIL